MASTRFPGKPLCDLLGKPMIQWVWERAKAAEVTDHIVVATPDQEILDACATFGAMAMLTRSNHPSGTDRIEEIASRTQQGLFINVQGDEPLIRPDDIRALAKPMLENPALQVGSLYTECPSEEEDNPAVVKVALAATGQALYFSRHAIPYPRAPRQIPLYKHLGLYAYRREALEAFVERGPMPLELAEGLEQLRFLEMGIPIQMFEGQGSGVAVDTPEQAEQVRRLLQREEPPPENV